MQTPTDPLYQVKPENTAEARRLFLAAQHTNGLPARAALFGQSARVRVLRAKPESKPRKFLN
jgi:hypothetical protein